MDYDQVLEHVGQFGLWQKLVIFMASLAAMAEAFMTLQVKYKSQCLKITQKVSFYYGHVNFTFFF